MIRILASATFATLLPLSSALGATFSFDVSAALSLTSVTGVVGDFVIFPVDSTVGGATDNFGGAADRTGAVAVNDSGFSAELSGSGASGLSTSLPFMPSFAFSTASTSPGFGINTNGLSQVTANFTFSFHHLIATNAVLLSETSSVQSTVRLTQFQNGVSRDLLLNTLVLNTGFGPGPESEQAEDGGAIDFSVVVPAGPSGQSLGLQLFISARGDATTFAEVTPTPVPLPPSAALFATGLGALTLVRRRQGSKDVGP